LGLIGLGHHGHHQKPVELNLEWVNLNFSEQYLTQVQNMATSTKRTKRFLDVPPGDVNTSPPPKICKKLHSQLPGIEYLQGRVKSCLISSLGSALKYLGFDDSVITGIMQVGMDNIHLAEQPQKIAMAMGVHVKGFQSRKIKSGFPLLDQSKWTVYPRMIVLQAQDGGIEHAITVVGGLLFDSNYVTAIPLTKSNLDWCCGGCFSRVHCGYEFFEDPNKKKKIVTKSLEETCLKDNTPKKAKHKI
jgi:hypothetical protein